ncbi:MAG: hypothetical protein IJB65_05780 [Clostridia bacterium]|nr:hypothetical protein [Clostridia bacterium]
MKIKQVESLLKAAKHIELFTERGCQWLGDGMAFYPVYNLPKLTREHIFTIFDVPEDKRNKFFFGEQDPPAHIDLKDFSDHERLVKRFRLSFVIGGRTVELIETDVGLVCLDGKYLKPFQGEPEGFELYERISRKTGVYIAVKTGHSLAGVIMPLRIIGKEFVQELEHIVNLARFALPDTESAQCQLCE